MKNLMFIIFFLSTGLIFSCEKESRSLPSQEIDNISILDRESNVIQEYKYDRVNKQFIGEAPEITLNRSNGNGIKGTFVKSEPNGSGGENVLCLKSTKECW